MTKKTTDEKIDELSQLMKSGFENVDKRFDEAEKRTDERIDGLARMTAEGFGNIKNEMDARFDKIDERFEKVEENFREINMKFHDRDENVRRNTTRIEKLEENAGVV